MYSRNLADYHLITDLLPAGKATWLVVVDRFHLAVNLHGTNKLHVPLISFQFRGYTFWRKWVFLSQLCSRYVFISCVALAVWRLSRLFSFWSGIVLRLAYLRVYFPPVPFLLLPPWRHRRMHPSTPLSHLFLTAPFQPFPSSSFPFLISYPPWPYRDIRYLFTSFRLVIDIPWRICAYMSLLFRSSCPSPSPPPPPPFPLESWTYSPIHRSLSFVPYRALLTLPILFSFSDIAPTFAIP